MPKGLKSAEERPVCAAPQSLCGQGQLLAGFPRFRPASFRCSFPNSIRLLFGSCCHPLAFTLIQLLYGSCCHPLVDERAGKSTPWIIAVVASSATASPAVWTAVSSAASALFSRLVALVEAHVLAPHAHVLGLARAGFVSNHGPPLTWLWIFWRCFIGIKFARPPEPVRVRRCQARFRPRWVPWRDVDAFNHPHTIRRGICCMVGPMAGRRAACDCRGRAPHLWDLLRHPFSFHEGNSFGHSFSHCNHQFLLPIWLITIVVIVLVICVHAVLALACIPLALASRALRRAILRMSSNGRSRPQLGPPHFVESWLEVSWPQAEEFEHTNRGKT